MAEFVNFEFKDNIDDVIDVDKGEEMYKNVSDSGFTDDENKFDENIEDYYTFTNVSRSIEEAMQDSFINFDYSQEDNKYYSDDCHPSEEINDEFKDPAKNVKHILLVPHIFENID